MKKYEDSRENGYTASGLKKKNGPKMKRVLSEATKLVDVSSKSPDSNSSLSFNAAALF